MNCREVSDLKKKFEKYEKRFASTFQGLTFAHDHLAIQLPRIMYPFQTNDSNAISGLHILVVEDSIVLGEVLRFNLEQEGFHVTWAADGKEAIEVVHTRLF